MKPEERKTDQEKQDQMREFAYRAPSPDSEPPSSEKERNSQKPEPANVPQKAEEPERWIV